MHTWVTLLACIWTYTCLARGSARRAWSITFQIEFFFALFTITRLRMTFCTCFHVTLLACTKLISVSSCTCVAIFFVLAFFTNEFSWTWVTIHAGLLILWKIANLACVTLLRPSNRTGCTVLYQASRINTFILIKIQPESRFALFASQGMLHTFVAIINSTEKI